MQRMIECGGGGMSFRMCVKCVLVHVVWANILYSSLF